MLVLINFILTTIFWGEYNYYSHFTYRKTDTTGKWTSQNSASTTDYRMRKYKPS